ncbi:APOL6 protein, partial [Amia calva]|nr:APOL6 protein [Amia calva]
FYPFFENQADELQKMLGEMEEIADGVDKFHRGATVASVTGGVVSAAGGIATITGLVLAPFTFGASLIVTGVGLGVAAAGGLTSATAALSETINNSLDRTKVEKIFNDYKQKIEQIEKTLKFIEDGVEVMNTLDYSNLNQTGFVDSKLDFDKMKLARQTGRGLINVVEMVRVVQMGRLAGGTMRAVRVAGTATGILSGFFLILDAYFIAKDSMDLHEGKHTEFANNIRDLVEKLQEGLDDLKQIHKDMKLNPESAN